jgi:uncharacterized OB-fold protein
MTTSDTAVSPPQVDIQGSGAVLASRGYLQQEGEARKGTLVASECPACAALAWPPLARCHQCLGEVRERRLGESGRLYSYSVLHAGPPGWPLPYAVGYVDLPEGVRVFTHLRGWEQGLPLDGEVTLHHGAPDERVRFWFAPSARNVEDDHA